MSSDDLLYRVKSAPPKVWVGVGVGVILLAVMIWQWMPSPAPTVDPKVQQDLQKINADKDANPPVPDVPVTQTDGPRRKATKVN